MKQTKIFVIVLLMISLSTVVPMVQAQTTLTPHEEYKEAIKEIYETTTSPRFNRLFNMIKRVIAPYVTDELRLEAEVQGHTLYEKMLSLEFDWGTEIEFLARGMADLFVNIFLISKLLFGQLLGEVVGLALCAIVYICFAPLGILYSSVIALDIFEDMFMLPENEEYFTLSWWIYSCGVIVGPFLWIALVTAVLILVVPICLVASIPVYLVLAFPVWNLALQKTYDYFQD